MEVALRSGVSLALALMFFLSALDSPLMASRPFDNPGLKSMGLVFQCEAKHWFELSGDGNLSDHETGLWFRRPDTKFRVDRLDGEIRTASRPTIWSTLAERRVLHFGNSENSFKMIAWSPGADGPRGLGAPMTASLNIKVWHGADAKPFVMVLAGDEIITGTCQID